MMTGILWDGAVGNVQSSGVKALLEERTVDKINGEGKASFMTVMCFF